MNCLEFHRAKLADPRRLPDDAAAHARGCADCAAFARSIDTGERRVEEALAVPAPDGLADRVLLRARGGRAAWKIWGLAAGVALAVGLGLSAMLYRSEMPEPYARQAIAHVAMEPESLQTLNTRDGQALGELIRASGGTLKAPLGNVRYVRLCPVGAGTGLHIVFETPEGLATLLIVPAQPLAGVEQAASRDWASLARPAGRGHYAVVTPSAEKTAWVDRFVRERIDWGA